MNINLNKAIKAIEDMNTDYINIKVGDYHAIICTEDVSRILEKAYLEQAGERE